MRALPQWLLICVLWPAGFLFPCIMSCGRESLAVITEGGRLGNKHEGSLWGTGPGFHRLRGGSESGGAMFFSGGTAFNSLAGPLSRCFDRTVHVLPISDDGGSSAEIRRVFGAPALGDIRARLVKLAQVGGQERSQILELLMYRLDATDESKAARQWSGIVSGQDPVVARLDDHNIEHADQLKALIRQFDELIRPRENTVKTLDENDDDDASDNDDDDENDGGEEVFRLSNGSLGNFILLALLECRGGLQPAIDWLASASGVPSTARILPACSALKKSLLGTPAAARQGQPSIVTRGDEGRKTEREMAGAHGSTIEEALVRQRGGSADEEGGNVEGPIIQAVLENGDVITGQNMISHPPIYPREIPLKIAKKKLRRIHSVEKELSGGFESALLSPIACIRYAPPRPDAANSDVLDAIPSTNAIVFGPGSLFTSIMPSLILPGVGEALVAMPSNRLKVLLLNSGPDRETGGMDALGHVEAMTKGLNRYGELSYGPRSYITHVIVPEGCQVPIDVVSLSTLGIQVVVCKCRCEGDRMHRLGHFCSGGAAFVISQLSNNDKSATRDSAGIPPGVEVGI